MGQSLELAGAGDLTGGAPPAVRYARNRRAANSPESDVDAARACRANLLLVGAEPAVANRVRSLWATFGEPLMLRRSGDRLSLPPSSDPVETMIIEGVETLKDHEQRALQDWLVLRNGRTRVVSTAPVPLLPMVETGSFSAALYYRLNVFYIEVGSC
jgi:hypothetical protein